MSGPSRPPDPPGPTLRELRRLLAAVHARAVDALAEGTALDPAAIVARADALVRALRGEAGHAMLAAYHEGRGLGPPDRLAHHVAAAYLAVTAHAAGVRRLPVPTLAEVLAELGAEGIVAGEREVWEICRAAALPLASTPAEPGVP